jgi:hypothetical protein
MPFCPRCTSEYRPGFTRCADCDVELVEALPALPVPDGAPEGWVEIFRGEQVRADVLCAALDAAGIETLSPDEYASNLGWYAPGSFNFIRVLVKASDAARAKDVIHGIPPPE